MEKVAGSQEAGGTPSLPPPPPIGQPNVKPERVATPKYSIISRSGVGTTGRRIPLLTNHFKVSVDFQDAVFYQYSVCLYCDFFHFMLNPLHSMLMSYSELFVGFYNL